MGNPKRRLQSHHMEKWSNMLCQILEKSFLAMSVAVITAGTIFLCYDQLALYPWWTLYNILTRNSSLQSVLLTVTVELSFNAMITSPCIHNERLTMDSPDRWTEFLSHYQSILNNWKTVLHEYIKTLARRARISNIQAPCLWFGVLRYLLQRECVQNRLKRDAVVIVLCVIWMKPFILREYQHEYILHSASLQPNRQQILSLILCRRETKIELLSSRNSWITLMQ